MIKFRTAHDVKTLDNYTFSLSRSIIIHSKKSSSRERSHVMGGGLTFRNSRSGSNSVSWLLIPFVRPRSEGATRCYNIHIIPFNPKFSRWLFIHFLFFFFRHYSFLVYQSSCLFVVFLYSYINWSVGGNCQFIIYIIIKLKKNHLIIKFRIPKLDIDY